MLKKGVKNVRITSEELQTVLVEIEATLNSRPLTYVSTEDTEEPLTPSHLMSGRRLLSMPDHEEQINLATVNGEELRKRVAYLARLKEHFWRRWTKEYLLELRNAHRLRTKQPTEESIRAGDIVIMHEDGLQRGLWRLGRVETLITGKDGITRGATVKSNTRNQGRPTTLRRPLQKLYPLEHATTCPQATRDPVAETSDPVAENTEPAAANRPSNEPVAEDRPRRTAAVREDHERRLLIHNQEL